MKSLRFCLHSRNYPSAVGLITWLVLAIAAHAQQAAPAPAARGDDLVVLSPFVVNSSSDVGYRANSSLAGIGLNTKLTDIGASVSVVTSQFLEDTASTNLREMLIYTASTESTGFGGNLSGSDPALGGVPGEPSLGNGNAGNRIRGLAAADNARNYFRSVVPMDSYNTDRVEINRGANALLFGTGSPAGIINTSTRQANLSKNNGKFEFSLGTYGSNREIFTYNVAPLKGQLAIGVAFLRDDTKYQQNFAYSASRRQYAAFTVDPEKFRDKGIFTRTTLSASFERGDIRSNRPRVLTPSDRYSSWFEDTLPQDLKTLGARAKTVYDPTGVNNGSTSSFNVFTKANGQAAIGVIDNVNRAPVFYFQDVNATTPMDNIQNNPLSGGKPVVGRPMVLDNYRFPAEVRVINGMNTVIPARTGIVVGAYSRELSRMRSDFGLADGQFYTSDQMHDPSTFDFFNNTLIGPNSEGISNLQVLDASLQQLFFQGKVGVELSYNRQNWDESLQSMLPAAAPYISIDVNTRMWTGEVNPNFGRPFVSTPGSASYRELQLDTRRVKAFYEIDFQEKFKNRFGWIVGKHVIAALAQREISDTDVRGGGSLFYTPDFWPAGSGQSRGSNTGKRVATWVYLGEPGSSYFNQTSLAGAGLKGLQQDLMSFHEKVNSSNVIFTRLRATSAAQATLPEYAASTSSINLQRENREVTNTAGFANLSQSTLDSQALSFQGNWLGDHLVSTIGWRKEQNSAATVAAPFVSTGEGYVLVDDPRYKLEGRDPNLSAVVPQEYEQTLFAWSAVAKTPKQWLTRIPRVSALNFYYGVSENFQPQTTEAVSVFGTKILPPTGDTKEAGVFIEAFDGLVSARVNFFETRQLNLINPAVASLGAAIMQIDSRAFSMVASGALPPGGPPGTKEAHYPKNYILPPQALLDTFGYSITQNASGTFNRNVTNPGVTDTSDAVTKGMELEITLNPTRGLSFTANVAQAKSVRSNTGAYVRELLYKTPTSTGDPLAVEWLKPWAANTAIALGSVGNEGTSDQFILNNNFQATVLNPFNTAALSDGSPATEMREWRANLVARYLVQTGRFKGLDYGVGVRWQDKAAIGFPVATFETSTDAQGNIVLSPSDGVAESSDIRGTDVQHPFYGPDELNFDAWVGYQSKIMRDKVVLRVQLNVRNIGVKDELIPIRINPDGKEAAWSIAESQRFTLTTRFSF